MVVVVVVVTDMDNTCVLNILRRLDFGT